MGQKATSEQGGILDPEKVLHYLGTQKVVLLLEGESGKTRIPYSSHSGTTHEDRKTRERKIRSFTGEEYEKLLNAIQRCEGWYPGDEKFESMPDKVVGVKFLKHKATEFLVQTADCVQKWLTRAQAIAQQKLINFLQLWFTDSMAPICAPIRIIPVFMT